MYDVNQLTAAVQVIGSTAASTLQDWLYNKLLGTSVSYNYRLKTYLNLRLLVCSWISEANLLTKFLPLRLESIF